MLNRSKLEQRIDRFLTDEVIRVVSQEPTSLHLLRDDVELEDRYYLRHRIETVHRIRMTSQTDALALAVMIDEDYEAARWWSKYSNEELNHDLLYLKDLKQHGLDLEQVLAVGPFVSTLSMVQAIADNIKEIGSVSAVAYSVWVEWNSERASARVVERAAKTYSPAHVRGARAHLQFDVKKNHYQTMLDITHRLVKDRATEDGFFRLLRMISNHIAGYFNELRVCQWRPNV